MYAVELHLGNTACLSLPQPKANNFCCVVLKLLACHSYPQCFLYIYIYIYIYTQTSHAVHAAMQCIQQAHLLVSSGLDSGGFECPAPKCWSMEHGMLEPCPAHDRVLQNGAWSGVAKVHMVCTWCTCVCMVKVCPAMWHLGLSQPGSGTQHEITMCVHVCIDASQL